MLRKHASVVVLAWVFALGAGLVTYGGNASAARRPRATTTSVKATTTTTVKPATTTHFSTLAPGSALPSDAQCAASIHTVATATPEPRPDNNTANHTVPAPGSFSLRPMSSYYGYDDRAQTLEARVDGNFTGTTDQIIQWAACKWGWDENVVRAIAITESYWHQSQLGDYASSNCPPGYTPSCPNSFGLHQVRWTSDPVGSFPASRDSTAFNLDASMMIHRVCYEGYTLWLRNSAPTYAAGDLWGCVGQWYSGYWHDSGAETYIGHVQTNQANHVWTTSGF